MGQIAVSFHIKSVKEYIFVFDGVTMIIHCFWLDQINVHLSLIIRLLCGLHGQLRMFRLSSGISEHDRSSGSVEFVILRKNESDEGNTITLI